MKKFAFFFLLALPLSAQTNRFPPINTYAGDPTGGACTVPNSILQSTTTGGLYSCVGGVYVNNGGSVYPGVASNGQGLNVVGNVSAAIHDKGGQRFDIRPYGAKCDGSTDDSVAIAAAQAAAGSGNTVYVPAAVCVGTVTMSYANQTLYIEAGGKLLQPPGYVGYTITVTAANVSILGEGTVDTNRATLTGTSCNSGWNCGGLFISHTSGLTINGPTFINGYRGVYGQCTPSASITNTKMYSGVGNNAALIFLGWYDAACGDMGNITLSNNYLDTTAATNSNGVYTSQIWGFNDGATQTTNRTHDIQMNDNRFIKRQGSQDSTELRSIANVTIHGNYSQGGNMGISIVAARNASVKGNVSVTPVRNCLEAPGVKDSVYDGNICNGNGITQYDVTGGWDDHTNLWPVVPEDYTQNLTVSNEVAYGLTTANIFMLGAGVGAGLPISNYTLSNNSCSYAGTTVLGFNCFQIVSTQGFTITGGTMDGGTYARSVAYLTNSSTGTITGVHVSNFRGSFMTLYGSGTTVIDNLNVLGNNIQDTNGLFALNLNGSASLGTNIKTRGNTGPTNGGVIPDYDDYSNNVLSMARTGQPNGLITANVGSRYFQTDGNGDAWTKTTGTGNTGWARLINAINPGFINGADADQTLTVGAGSTAAYQAAVVFRDYLNAIRYSMNSKANGDFNIQDVANGNIPIMFKTYATGHLTLNASGTGAVLLNINANSGSGGVLFYSGGASPAQVASVDSTGKGTFNGGIKVASGGTAMTGNQGTGLLVQHSTGSLTSGNLLSADASGNAIDSGVAASSVGTPTAEFFSWGTFNASAGTSIPNAQTAYYSYTLPIPLVVAGLTYRVFTADNTATWLYDIGIYSLGKGTGTNGALLAHTGPVAGTALTGGNATFLASVTLQPGTYLVAVTSNCTSACLVLGGQTGPMGYSRSSTTGGVTSGGTLLNTITPGAASYAFGSSIWAMVMHN